MSRRRYLSKFESADGSTSYTFPAYRYEWEPSQGLRSPRAQISGAHYGLRLLGNAPSLKDIGQERVRCVFIGTKQEMDDEADNVRHKLYAGAFGKVWTMGDDGTLRWAWAEIAEMPQMTISYQSGMITPLIVGFNRFGDWRSASATTGSAAATGTVNIAVPGNADVFDAVITLYGTFTDPVLINGTVLLPDGVTPYKLQTNRDGSSSIHRVRFDAGSGAVEYSSNGGSSWADDYANFVRQAKQVQLMRMKGGVNNAFTFSGVSSGTIAWSLYGAWD